MQYKHFDDVEKCFSFKYFASFTTLLKDWESSHAYYMQGKCSIFCQKTFLPSFEETRRRLGTVLKLFKLLLGAV